MNEKIVTMADIEKLPKVEAVKLAASEDRKAQAAFIIVSKILFSLDQNRKDGDPAVATQLRKAGVRETTINNARYAAKGWKLVQSGDLTEEKFDSLSYEDFVNLETTIKPLGKEILKEVLTSKDIRKAISKHLPQEKKEKKQTKKTSTSSESTTDATEPTPGKPALEVVKTQAEVIPSESDLLELLGQLEIGTLQRVTAGEDVGSLYAAIIKFASDLTEAGITPAAPVAKAA